MGDSGWAYFEINGETVENQYTEALVDYIHDELDYGSWAGEFSATGTAVYDSDTKIFEGTDYYSEDENHVLDRNIKIAVPKNLWFDTVHVEVECHYEESCDVNVSLLVKNGFLTPQHSEICATLEKKLQDKFDEIFNTYEDGDYEFRHCNDAWILDRMGGEETKDGMLIFTINEIDISVSSTSERQIVMNLNDQDVLEHINNRLSSEDDE